MKKLTVIVIGFLLFSCNKNINTSLTENKNINTNQIEGKWIDSSRNLKLYIDSELEKVVFANGCEVVSSDFKRFEPAINFANIIKTQSQCKENIVDINKILDYTVFVQVNQFNQLVFLDKNRSELLILNKN